MSIYDHACGECPPAGLLLAFSQEAYHGTTCLLLVPSWDWYRAQHADWSTRHPLSEGFSFDHFGFLHWLASQPGVSRLQYVEVAVSIDGQAPPETPPPSDVACPCPHYDRHRGESFGYPFGSGMGPSFDLVRLADQTTHDSRSGFWDRAVEAWDRLFGRLP